MRWTFSLLSVALAAWAVGSLRGKAEPTPNAIFFCAVIFAAWFGGPGPGVMATVLSAILSKYFAAPAHELWTFTSGELVSRVMFLATGLFICWLTGRQRRAEAGLRALSEKLEDKVAARTAELSKTNAELGAEMVERKKAEAERQRAEEAVRQSEAELRSVIDSIPAMIWTAQADGSRAFVNQRWIEYTGLSTKAASGTGWQSALHPDDSHRYLANREKAIATGQPLEAEVRFQRGSDGQYRWFLVRAVPFRDEQGRIVKWYGVVTDIEDRKQTDDTLRQRTDELQRVNQELQRKEYYLAEGQRLSHTGSWAWNAKTNENVFWSEEHFRIYGFRPDEDAAAFKTARDRIHPEDVGVFDAAVNRAVEQETDFESDHRIMLPNGSVRRIHTVGHPVLNEDGELVEFIGTVMDVTEQRRAEAILSTEMRSLQMIARGAALQEVLDDLCNFMDQISPELISSVLLVDAEGKSLLQAAGPRVPKAWMQAISPLPIGAGVGSWGSAAQMKKQVTAVDIATDPLWKEYRDLALKFGFRAAWTRPIVSGNQTVLGMLAMYYRQARHPDQSDLVLAQRASHLAQIAIERDRAQQSLRAAEANLAHVTRVTTLGEMSASIAHEVNQPLTAIVNNANACLNLLADGLHNVGEVRAALEEIAQDGERAGDVIERIRGLVKKSPPQMTPCDIRAVVRDVAALALMESTGRGVSVKTQLGQAVLLVRGDVIQLQQVLLNLVMNGMEAMAQVEQPARLLEIGCKGEIRDGKAGVTVEVSDHGVGIKTEDMTKIFDAFYSTKPQGLGMGLAISRSLVESHGGNLWVSANEGPGATFAFWLPAVENNVT